MSRSDNAGCAVIELPIWNVPAGISTSFIPMLLVIFLGSSAFVACAKKTIPKSATISENETNTRIERVLQEKPIVVRIAKLKF
jgi:hypothetical protein